MRETNITRWKRMADLLKSLQVSKSNRMSNEAMDEWYRMEEFAKSEDEDMDNGAAAATATATATATRADQTTEATATASGAETAVVSHTDWAHGNTEAEGSARIGSAHDTSDSVTRAGPRRNKSRSCRRRINYSE